jgi:Predicted transcriptional regulators
MYWEINFNSDEAIYMQLRNHIIIGIATEQISEGDILPSVRQMANHIGINMHTVNKTYTILKEEGFIKLDKRKGTMIALDIDKLKAKIELAEFMKVILAKAVCQNINRAEIHEIVDNILDNYI